ncbi:MAG TPA: S53 family peptidase [Trebonia sp.]|nr:S53 family peptidase [Trebonia sp.]
MNGSTDGHRGRPRRAGTLAVLAAVAMLAPACSVVHVSLGGSASAQSPAYQAELAYAQCMRAHGLPFFPDPTSSGRSATSTHLGGNPGSPAARANAACKHLLTGGAGAGGGTGVEGSAGAGAGAVTDCMTSRPPCYAPRQLRIAYGIQPLLDRGITGRGQTVVLLEFPPLAAGSPGAGGDDQVPASSDIRQDLARFDGMFGLPTARLQVVNSLEPAVSPWQAAPEEVADTEVVHALAPDAAIRVVLIPSSYTASTATVSAAVIAAVQRGLTQGGVISLSAGAGEQCFTPAELAKWNQVLQAAQRDQVTVVASMGDSGAAASACPPETGSAAVKGVDLPASDPLTLAVGGTRLLASQATGAYISETVWNTSSPAGPAAGGGGFSALFSRPAYQDGIAGIGAARGVPDVAADADPDTGMALAISDGGRQPLLIGAGGTSVAAPLWAAVIALADQYARRDLGFVNPALYQIGRSTHYHQAFHDVTTGNNTGQIGGQTITGYPAGPGWDPATGWGSPNAQVLVPLLARYTAP